MNIKFYTYCVSIIMMILFPIFSNAQDAKKILLDAYSRLQKIEKGYYEVTNRMKYMSGPDTSTWKERCWFKKLPKDDIFGIAFHNYRYNEGAWTYHSLYTGNEFVSGSDTSGTYQGIEKWKADLKNMSEDIDLYLPFTDSKFNSLFTPKDIRDKQTKVSFLGQEVMNGQTCDKINVRFQIEDDPEMGIQSLDNAFTFWISTTTHLVLQYTTYYVMLMNKDTMVQHQQFSIDTFSIDQPIDETWLSMKSLPTNYKLQDYVVRTKVAPLEIGTMAPDWTFTSLRGEEIQLSKLSGQLVLVDFFYKSCFPCMQALPALEALHMKYKDKGLMVVGLDPYDDKADNLEDFLAKREITYTVVYGDKEIPKSYRVEGYPTMFLIDRNGKIIKIQTGFGPGVEENLEKLIIQHL